MLQAFILNCRLQFLFASQSEACSSAGGVLGYTAGDGKEISLVLFTTMPAFLGIFSLSLLEGEVACGFDFPAAAAGEIIRLECDVLCTAIRPHVSHTTSLCILSAVEKESLIFLWPRWQRDECVEVAVDVRQCGIMSSRIFSVRIGVLVLVLPIVRSSCRKGGHEPSRSMHSRTTRCSSVLQ